MIAVFGYWSELLSVVIMKNHRSYIGKILTVVLANAWDINLECMSLTPIAWGLTGVNKSLITEYDQVWSVFVFIHTSDLDIPSLCVHSTEVVSISKCAVILRCFFVYFKCFSSVVIKIPGILYLRIRRCSPCCIESSYTNDAPFMQ